MKTLFISILAFISITTNAQKFTFKDTFDSNENGWTEVVDKKGESIIIDGTLKIKSKLATGYYESHCFTDLDVRSNFEIKCEVKVKSINEKSNFGLIIDYIDDGNFIAFMVAEGNAQLVKYENYILTGRISSDIKLKAKKNSDVELLIRNTTGKVIFEVNGMKAIEARYLELKSGGIGFYVMGEQTVAFDNLEIIQ